LTRNGLAAHPTASHGSGPPAAPTPDSDSDGTYHHGTALNLDLSSDARPGSDSCTNATHKGTRPLRARDHWHPSVFISEPPGPPLAGPKHLVYPGPLRASCARATTGRAQAPRPLRATPDLVRNHSSPAKQVPPSGVFKFPSITAVNGHPFFPYI
jgi:hypothetical protein